MVDNSPGIPAEQDALEPIAIVGVACRFPGDATSPQSFFDMLARGRAAWSEVPTDRYSIDSFYHPNGSRQGTTTSRGGHFLKEDLGLFDAPVSLLLVDSRSYRLTASQFCNFDHLRSLGLTALTHYPSQHFSGRSVCARSTGQGTSRGSL